jgi:hypothetical protein
MFAALGLNAACGGRTVAGDGTEEGSASNSSADSEGEASASAEASSSGPETTATDSESETGESETGSLPFECEDPQPIMQANTDTPSGWVRCADGFVHREEAVACLAPQIEDDPLCADQGGLCATAADCQDAAYGGCAMDPIGIAGCTCRYGCETDADCETGEVCACAGVTGEFPACIPAGCVDDASCGDGLCGLSAYDDCCGVTYQAHCADEVEECHVSAECEEGLCDPEFPEGGTVAYMCSAHVLGGPAGEWSCVAPGWCNCDCGRPFFVEGSARTAPACERSDWFEEFGRAQLPSALRARLAAHWTEVGLFEHASVASFARFCLQLMHLGAPPQLLAENQRAMADEIEHARLAFGLARRYSDVAVGPGALSIEGSLDASTDLITILEGLVVEACVGETLAAIEAYETAAHARDSVVAGVLTRIAADEWRHAQLGWKSLRWILDQHGRELETRAVAMLESVATAIGSSVPPLEPAEPELRAHGLLDPGLRAQVRRRGVEEVVRPLIEALRPRPPAGVGASTYSGTR